MRIRLSNKFYKIEAIEGAIAAFGDFCVCKILDDSFEVEITPLQVDENKIAGEFCNFVLGITKDKMLF